jgi:hypothetical protein
MRGVLRHQRYLSQDLKQDLGLRPGEPEIYGTVINILSFDYDLRIGGRAVRARNIGDWPVNDLEIVVYDRQDSSDICIDFTANPER